MTDLRKIIEDMQEEMIAPMAQIAGTDDEEVEVHAKSGDGRLIIVVTGTRGRVTLIVEPNPPKGDF